MAKKKEIANGINKWDNANMTHNYLYYFMWHWFLLMIINEHHLIQPLLILSIENDGGRASEREMKNNIGFMNKVYYTHTHMHDLMLDTLSIIGCDQIFCSPFHSRRRDMHGKTSGRIRGI